MSLFQLFDKNKSDELSNKTKILLIATPFIIFFGILIFIEISVRLDLPHITSLQFFTGSVLQDEVKVSYGQQIFEGDALLGWKLKPNLKNVFWDFTTFSTNDQGLRYYKNISGKSENTIRIISLGDSVTFGYRVPTTFQNDSSAPDPKQMPYTTLLENYLKNKNPDKNIEVIPLAVPGYSTYQGLEWLERDIRSLKPDLVTILFGWNDTELHSRSEKETLPDNFLAYISRKIVSQSQALIYLSDWLHVKNDITKSPNNNLTPRVSKEDFVKNILAMNELATKYGAKTVIIGPIYMDNQSNGGAGIRISEYRLAISEAAKQAQIPYLEIEQLTENGNPGNISLFGEPIHPNYLGHQLIADQLLKFITGKQIIGNLILN